MTKEEKSIKIDHLVNLICLIIQERINTYHYNKTTGNQDYKVAHDNTERKQIKDLLLELLER